MTDRTLYFVCGGVFTDTGFTTLEQGTEEILGPFETEAEAEAVWGRRMRAPENFDRAGHRLMVVPLRLPYRVAEIAASP
ncbi:MAG TPA: hypothetical protein VME92_18705 [Acetobacteraceae bacterium]|nr:hypothetical protein [Acetobacteraceae bacterium]